MMESVFVSYSHDSQGHKDRVLALADRLRSDGIDCNLDQYVMSPPQGWPNWMLGEIEAAEFVLVIATENYTRRFSGKEASGMGKGAKWEGGAITQALFEAEGSNIKFVPVVLSAQDTVHIPSVLRGVTYYDVSVLHGYHSLYRHLTKQPEVVKHPVGKLKTMPVRERQTDFVQPSKSKAQATQVQTDYSAADRASDVELLRFYSQCLDRPAIQDNFRTEGSWHHFDKAIEDTITAINTGTLRSRDGAILSSGKGKSFLRHQGWRTRMDGITDLLRALRSRFKQALSDGTLTTGGGTSYYLSEPALQQWIDTTRHKIVHDFNEVCSDAGIPPLHFS